MNFSTKDPSTVKFLIENYCSAVLSAEPQSEGNFIYNAKYSAFVYLLCSNISTASASKLDAKYFKRTSFAELWFQDIVTDENWYQINLCSQQSSLSNDCDLATNIPDLFNNIMNDYFNMKQWSLYWLLFPFTSDEELKTQVNWFSNDYFTIDLCDNKVRPYDKTCRAMKSYIKNVRNILSEVYILDTDEVLKLPNPASCASTPDKNIFVCWLKDTWASMVSFVNLLYNELYFYRLFMWYYLVTIQRFPLLLINNQYNNDYSVILKSFSSQYIWSKNALSLSLRMMRDTYMAFPLHIWFLMYQEDLNRFWKTLANIASPIYILYDKLRNVQSQ